MKIAVIGAGLAGLVAANELSEYAKVKVYENSQIGGLVSSYYVNGYYIEKFYHHIFRFDRDLLDLISKLKLRSKLVWKVVKIGFGLDGEMYSLSTPIEIITYPHLNFIEKLKLALFTLKSRYRNFKKYDNITALDGIRNELGDGVLKNFFLPLLKSKFGENYKNVSYSWLLARVAIRSNRKLSGEELGYLRHGFYQLIERLAQNVDIIKKRGDIKLRSKWQVNGEDFDAIIYTAPILHLANRFKFNLPNIKYQSSICALIGLKEPLTDDLYWINIFDNLPFGAIIEHTNFMDFNDYGEHLIYLASYTSPDSKLFNLDKNSLIKIFLSGIKKYGIDVASIRWVKLSKAKYSGPIYETGYLSKVTPYKIYDGFYIAGMTSEPNYPERSMNGSIKAGFEVSKIVKKDFQLSSR